MDHRGLLADRLLFAIANRRLIRLRYDGSVRIVEPHDYGVQRSVERLLAYQLRRISGAPRPAPSGWRLFDIAKIDECAVLEETFPGSRAAAHEHHYEWETVYARVR